MDNNLYDAQNCDCGVLMRKGASYVEYYDTTTQLWVRMYPAFRVYNDPIKAVTFLGADGRQVTIEAGCSLTLDGIVYTDLTEIFNALTDIVTFFFNLSNGGGECDCFKGGLYADRPVTPVNYETYWATDLGTTGTLIIWDGLVWRNVTGALIVVP